MLNFKVQQIAGIYPWLDRLYCPTSLQKGSGTFAKTQTIQLPSLYAHRSVMQRRRQVAAAGGAPGVLRGHMARAGVPTSRVKAPSGVQGQSPWSVGQGVDPLYGRLIRNNSGSSNNCSTRYLSKIVDGARVPVIDTKSAVPSAAEQQTSASVRSVRVSAGASSRQTTGHYGTLSGTVAFPLTNDVVVCQQTLRRGCLSTQNKLLQ